MTSIPVHEGIVRLDDLELEVDGITIVFSAEVEDWWTTRVFVDYAYGRDGEQVPVPVPTPVAELRRHAENIADRRNG